MKDKDSAKERLISELEQMRQRVAECEELKTKCEETEERLKASEERMRLLVQNIPDIIITMTRDGKILAINRTVTGFTVEETIGRNGYDYVDPEYRDSMKESLERVFQTGEPDTFEVIGDGPKGPKTAWYDTRVIPIDREGNIVAVTLISTDVTERRRAENELIEREERYRHLFEQSPVGIGLATQDGEVISSNKAMESITGYSEKEIKKINLVDIYENPEDRKVLIEVLRQRGGVTNYPVRLKRKDGTPYDALLSVSRFHLGNLDLFQTICLDITERKKAEEELERTTQELRVLNEIYRIVTSSQDRSEILHKFIKPIIDFCGAKAAALYDVDYEKKDAVLLSSFGIPDSIRKKIEHIGMDDDVLSNVLSSNGVFIVEEDMPSVETQRDRLKERLGIKRSISFLIRCHGRVNAVAIIGYPRDEEVSAEKRSLFKMVGNQLGIALERLDLLDKLAKREKELKKLTAGLIDSIEKERRQMALSLHDEMGQTLVALSVELEMLEEKLEQGDKQSMKLIREIRQLLQHITETTRQISSALHPAMLEDLGLIPAIHWYAGRFVESESLKVDIEAIGFDEKLPDPVRLTVYRVVQEALTNVVKHSDASRVSLKLTKGYPRVIVAVKDNGKGFSVEEEIPRKGLGIVGMRERVELLGGDFRIESSPGKGTRIRVTLPLEA